MTGRSYIVRQAAVQETLSTRAALVDTLSSLKDTETGVRGFLLTADEAFLEPFQSGVPRLERDSAALDRLTGADPSLRGGATPVALLAHRKVGFLNDLIARRRQDKTPAPDTVPMLVQGKATMDAIRVEVARMIADTDLRLTAREQAMAVATLRLQLMLGAAVLGAAVLTLAGLSSARRDARESRASSEQLSRDVSARQQAELRLRDQSRLLESVLANIGDAVLVVDHERTVVMMNPAASRIAPYVIGMKLSVEWSKQVETFLADGKTLFPPATGPLTRALRGHPSDDVEMVIRVPTGELRSFSVTTRPMSDGGTTVSAVAVFRDMTALNLATKQLLEKSEQLRDS